MVVKGSDEMKKKWRWVGWMLLGIALLAAAGLGMSMYMFSRWSELRAASPQDADGAFSSALAEAGGGPPYLEIFPQGTVRVRRELEQSEPTALGTLHLLVWEPDPKAAADGCPLLVRPPQDDRIPQPRHDHVGAGGGLGEPGPQGLCGGAGAAGCGRRPQPPAGGWDANPALDRGGSGAVRAGSFRSGRGRQQ